MANNLLPKVEDVYEHENKTEIVNKIRISRIKGSYKSLISPNERYSSVTGATNKYNTNQSM